MPTPSSWTGEAERLRAIRENTERVPFTEIGREVTQFIYAILGERPPFIELRAIRGSEVKQFFLDRGIGQHLLDEYAYDLDHEGWDVYYGVLPRLVESGRDQDCAPSTRVLWQDIDLKHIEGGHLAALLNLQRTGLDPSILVDSGNGLHAYHVGSSRVDLQACKLEYSIVSPK